MQQEINVEEAGKAIMKLSEVLSVEYFEVTTESILENIEARSISHGEAEKIRVWLST